MWTSDAPASKASWVDSICCGGVTGTAGLSFFRGTAPVMATVMMTGCDMIDPLLQRPGAHANMSGRRNSPFRQMKTGKADPGAMTKPLPPNPRDPTYDDILAIARLIEAG